MKVGWHKKQLASVTKKITDGSHNPPKGVADSEYLMLSSKNVFDDDFHYEDPRYLSQEQFLQEDKRTGIEPGDVLLTIVGTIGRCAVVPIDAPKITLQRSVAVIRPDRAIVEPRFMMYSFIERNEELNEQARGVAQKGIYLEALRELEIVLPPLPEQQRIVGILDEAFDGIATAKANAEQNLQNARALFESHLQSVFTRPALSGVEGRGEGWVEKPISQCFKVRSGDFLPAKAMVLTGEVDVYGGNGINGKHDQKNLSGENIIIGRVGAKCGNVRFVRGDLWLTDNAFHISEYFQNFYLPFLARLLELKQLRGTANQAAQPVISYTTIKEVILNFPSSLDEQKRIADGLDELEVETQRLESLYQRKLAALAELKKSLLHQAFSGAL